MKKYIFVIAMSLLVSCEFADLTEIAQEKQENLLNSKAPGIDVLVGGESVVGLTDPVDCSSIIEFTVENTGNTTLVLDEVSIINDTDSAFNITGPASSSIEPGQTVTFSVTLKEIITSGITYYATIQITSNADDSPVKIDITGYVELNIPM